MAMVLADLNSSVMCSASLVDIRSSCNLQRDRDDVLALALDLWPGRFARLRQQSGEMFEFGNGSVVIVEQRLQQMRDAPGAVLAHQRTVVPEHFRFGCREPLEHRVARLPQVAQDSTRVVELVGGRDETGFRIFCAYPAQVTQLAGIPLGLALVVVAVGIG